GADITGVSRRPVFLCCEPSTWAAPSNGAALRRTGGGRRADVGAGRSLSSRQGANDHPGSQSLAGIAGVPEGEGIGLPARTVDDPTSGPPRTRAWTCRGTWVPARAGSGDGGQDPQ